MNTNVRIHNADLGGVEAKIATLEESLAKLASQVASLGSAQDLYDNAEKVVGTWLDGKEVYEVSERMSMDKKNAFLQGIGNASLDLVRPEGVESPYVFLEHLFGRRLGTLVSFEAHFEANGGFNSSTYAQLVEPLDYCIKTARVGAVEARIAFSFASSGSDIGRFIPDFAIPGVYENYLVFVARYTKE